MSTILGLVAWGMTLMIALVSGGPGVPTMEVAEAESAGEPVSTATPISHLTALGLDLAATVESAGLGDGQYVQYYPNPTSNRVTITARGLCWCRIDGLRVSIYESNGALAWSEESETPRINLDLATVLGMANGTYIVHSELQVDGIWVPMENSFLSLLR